MFEANLGELPKPELPWVKLTPEWQHFEITGVTAVPGKYGKPDIVLALRDLSGLGEYRFTCWGGNYNFCYNTFGNQPSNWVGKRVKIRSDNGTRTLASSS